MDREDGSCQFYVELRDFFQELDKAGKTCILDDDEDFMVQGNLNLLKEPELF